MDKRNILFFIPDQFGYSAGYHYYCKYLVEHGYKVTVICLDTGREKIKVHNNISIHYIVYNNKLLYRYRMLKCLRQKSNGHEIIILKYMIGISMCLLLLNRRKVILDIRTGSINKNKVKRYIENSILKIESRVFKNKMTISKMLAKKLKLVDRNMIYLPLGADELAFSKKEYYNAMHLMYIGTFRGRNLYQCVEGLGMFYKEYHDKIDITFDMIGEGTKEEEAKIQKYISKYKLTDIVKLRGKLNHEKARVYFESCNYGISYVPQKEYYELQPPTKIYEYLMSGLVCIATNTTSNREIVERCNGVLHCDNAKAFKNALIAAFDNRSEYDTTIIKASASNNSWKRIVEDILIKRIEKIQNNV